MLHPTPIAKLIDSFIKLPGVDIRAAARLALYTIGVSDEDMNEFTKSLLIAKRELAYYSIRGSLTDGDPYSTCTNGTRGHSVILVVEDSEDVFVTGRIREYRSLCYVLHDLISPMNDAGPDDTNLRSLITRLMDNKVNEVIITTSAAVGGEVASMYILRILKPTGIKATRLARGLAVGSNTKYANEITLLRAIESRVELRGVRKAARSYFFACHFFYHLMLKLV